MLEESLVDGGDSMLRHWDDARKQIEETLLRYFDIRLNPLNYNPSMILSLFTSDSLSSANTTIPSIEFIDTSFYQMPIVQPSLVMRHLQLFPFTSKLSMAAGYQWFDVAISQDEANDNTYKACIVYDLMDSQNCILPNTRSIAFFHLTRKSVSRTNDKSASSLFLITKVFTVEEPPQPKPGSLGLYILKFASQVLDVFTDKNSSRQVENSSTNYQSSILLMHAHERSMVGKYFQAWNERKMEVAVECFTANCTYYDLQYSEPLIGRTNIERHLNLVAECLPDGFQFCMDDFALEKNKMGLQWHVENDGQELPFTRGCSFYVLESNSSLRQSPPQNETSSLQSTYSLQRIHSGIDIPEPAVLKGGLIESIFTKLYREPVRFLPLAVWLAYMYIVFLSDGILPGYNALAFEQRTWEEVRDLSLNFFLVAPLLQLPFSPVVHPMLEGIFNLLLAWAAMFSGFLSDDRKNKPNLLPFGIIVLGMQLLTSAFLLPYLVTRTSEVSSPTISSVSSTKIESEQANLISSGCLHDDFDKTHELWSMAEWRPLGPLLAGVGTTAIIWSFIGRFDDFGNIHERFHSLVDLLSIDRVGCSFIVDLGIFSLFQGWLVDDDLRRRSNCDLNQLDSTTQILRRIGKFLPFYGLGVYFFTRPRLVVKK